MPARTSEPGIPTDFTFQRDRSLDNPNDVRCMKGNGKTVPVGLDPAIREAVFPSSPKVATPITFLALSFPSVRAVSLDFSKKAKNRRRTTLATKNRCALGASSGPRSRLLFLQVATTS